MPMSEIPDPHTIEEDLQEILKELGYGPLENGVTFPEELLKVTAVLILAALLLYFFFYIVNRSFFYKREHFIKEKGEGEEYELMEKKDYSGLYRKAVDFGKKANYLEGVRMLYMALLILLDTKEVIQYHPSLTNFEYRLKVHSYPFSRLFEEITRTFDMTYYGGKPATGKDFSFCVDAFTQIEEAVS